MSVQRAGRYDVPEDFPPQQIWEMGVNEFAYCCVTLSDGAVCDVDETSHPDDAKCGAYGGCRVQRFLLRRRGLG